MTPPDPAPTAGRHRGPRRRAAALARAVRGCGAFVLAGTAVLIAVALVAHLLGAEPNDVVNTTLLWVVVALALYTAAINTSYLILVTAAFLDLGRYRSRIDFANYDEWFRDPNVQGVSVLIPAHNESASILTTLAAMAGLHYPDFEVIVIDDGSRDDTCAKIVADLQMSAVPLLATHQLPTKATVTGTWVATRGNVTFTLVTTTGGGKADALNVGTNYARKELVCCVDADSLLENTALLHVARPFAENPNVVATGGVVRVANGATVRAGRVTDPHVPAALLPIIQVVEYLRAFFIGREGWSRVGGMIIISGAFGVFRTSTLVEIGGYAVDCIGEDAELVVRLHRRLYENGLDGGEIQMVPEPVAWTEVPTSLRVLSRQRRRWHRGLADLFSRHRGMVGNPRYGVVGVLTMPWFLLFELLAPAIELTGYVYLATLLLLGGTTGLAETLDPDSPVAGAASALGVGELNLTVAAALALASILFSAFVTLLACLAEELTFARYRTNRDLARLLAGVAVENLGFRQLSAWWRLRGLIDGIRNHATAWGDMERAGFGDAHPDAHTDSGSGSAPATPTSATGEPAR